MHNTIMKTVLLVLGGIGAGCVHESLFAAGDHGFAGTPFTKLSDVRFEIGKKVVFVFYSPTCSACTMLVEPFNEVVALAEDVQVFTVNGADKSGDIPILVKAFDIDSYPTIASVNMVANSQKLVGAPQQKPVLMSYFGISGKGQMAPAKSMQVSEIKKPVKPPVKPVKKMNGNGTGNGSKKLPKNKKIKEEIALPEEDEFIVMSGMGIMPSELEEPEEELLDIDDLLMSGTGQKGRGK